MFKKNYSVNVPTLIVCLIASVAVSAPLSNAANDQVRVVVKKITGKQGKRGPRGYTGKQGPAGERGPTGEAASDTSGWGPRRIFPGQTVTVLGPGKCMPYEMRSNVIVHTDGVDPDDLDVVQEGDYQQFGFIYYMAIRNPTDFPAWVSIQPVCVPRT